MLAFRPAIDADIPFACEAHHKGYYDTIIKQFPPFDEAQQDAFFMDAWQKHPHVIIQWQGEDCGYLASELLPDCYKVIKLVLHPRAHGRGIGSAVLEWAKKQAIDAGLPLRLQVLLMNTAYDFYLKNGFVELSRDHKNIYMEWRPNA